MSSASKTGLVLFQGYPGSGKSSIAGSLARDVRQNGYERTHHLSIGSHLRNIVSGKIKSSFNERLTKESRALSKSQRLDDSLVNKIIDEYLGSLGDSELVLIDGYPLYTEQVPVFQENVSHKGIHVLGLLNIDVPEDVAINRILNRGTRPNEDAASVEFAKRRIEEHRTDCLGTVALLSEMYPSATIDGSLSPYNVLSEVRSAIANFEQTS